MTYYRVEPVVLNTGLDVIQTESILSVCSGYQSYAGSPAVLGASGANFSNKIPDIPQFSGSEHEKDRVKFEQWFHSISDARRNFSEQLVRGVINKSCVNNAVDVICCLPPGTILDDIITKFKWLYGSV